jgi:hypothetical protein
VLLLLAGSPKGRYSLYDRSKTHKLIINAQQPSRNGYALGRNVTHFIELKKDPDDLAINRIHF